MFNGSLRAVVGGAVAFGLLVSAQAAQAGAVVRDGFTFADGQTAKIVVFRPDVQVGTLRVGGLDEANADWTATARANMQKAFESASESRDAHLTFLGDPDGENAQLLNDYRGLFQVVSNEAMTHALFFDKLATRQVPAAQPGGRATYKFDWTMGPEAKRLKEITGADYAMFVYTHDSYGDAGRKVAQLLMAGIFGAYVPAGVHMGYAGLVDLSTGNLVWLNADIQMGGDLREADGADKRVKELMRGFPKPGGAAAVASATPTPAAPSSASSN